MIAWQATSLVGDAMPRPIRLAAGGAGKSPSKPRLAGGTAGGDEPRIKFEAFEGWWKSRMCTYEVMACSESYGRLQLPAPPPPQKHAPAPCPALQLWR